MRSKLFTILLTVLALTCGALAFIRLTQNDLSSVFGEPARAAGLPLFEFQPSEVRGMVIDHQGRAQSYQERQGQWVYLSKNSPEDRADYRVLEALLACCADLRITDSFPANEKNLKLMGLSPAKAQVKFKDPKGNEIASFSFGKKAAWHLHIPPPDPESAAQDWPAIYVHPTDSEYIYLCSSAFLDDILVNGFGPHRDLRPFFFPPELLAEITISQPGGNIVLAREDPRSAWKITKPFRLDANPEATAALVSGLYKLTAKKASNKPAPLPEDPALRLSLRFFSRSGVHEQAITLQLDEPTSGDKTVYTGRLNDWRENIEFTIPRVATAGYVAVDSLPLSIDSLRGTTLSGLELSRLQRLTLTGPELDGKLEIFIEKSPLTKEWRAQRSYQGLTTAANEVTFFKVKKALSEEKAIATVSEAAEDLSIYGLEYPILSLKTQLFPDPRAVTTEVEEEVIHFGFRVDPEGLPHYYFRRGESRIVMEISSDSFFKISSQPFLWRDSSAWDFDIIDLNFLRIEKPNSEPLTLEYSDLSQSWAARQGDKDATGLLNENRANRYIENLEKLAVTRWLGPDHRSSQRALQDPIFQLTAVFKRPDDADASVTTKTLKLAGASQTGGNQFYFGQVEGDPQTFILDLAAVKKLATPLLESE